MVGPSHPRGSESGCLMVGVGEYGDVNKIGRNTCPAALWKVVRGDGLYSTVPASVVV